MALDPAQVAQGADPGLVPVAANQAWAMDLVLPGSEWDTELERGQEVARVLVMAREAAEEEASCLAPASRRLETPVTTPSWS